LAWLDWFVRRDAPAAWPRPQHEPSGLSAEFEFFVVGAPSDARVPDDLREYGHAEARLPEGVRLTPLCRAEIPGDFDALVERITGGLQQEHPHLYAATRAAERLHAVTAEGPDAGDFRMLQGAWALVRALMHAGAVGLYDNRARSWRTAHKVGAPDADPSRLARSYRVMGAPLEGHAGGFVVWTAGLGKAARPELLTLSPEVHLALSQQVLLDLGEACMRGRRLRVGDTVHLHGVRARVDALVPGENAPALDLENRCGGLLVVLFTDS
jgi:hypothetical protein